VFYHSEVSKFITAGRAITVPDTSELTWETTTGRILLLAAGDIKKPVTMPPMVNVGEKSGTDISAIAPVLAGPTRQPHAVFPTVVV